MPILATLNSSTKSFRTSQRNLPPSMCWKLKYQFSMGKVHTCILLSILNPLGFLPGEFWWRMLDFREKGMVFAEEVGPVCFIVSTDKSWLQLFFLLTMWHGKLWYCPHWEVWWETEKYYTSPCCVVLHQNTGVNTPRRIMKWRSMAARYTCQLLSTVHGTFDFLEYFLWLLHTHPPSAEYIHFSTTPEEHGSWKYLSECRASG